jgi:hypothetical protein
LIKVALFYLSPTKIDLFWLSNSIESDPLISDFSGNSAFTELLRVRVEVNSDAASISRVP